MPTITLEPDGPPIVRILGVTLRRAAADADLAARMDKMSGKVVLQSTTDPQAATIDFDKGAVHVTHGAAADADMTISADLMTMGQPGAPKPKVSGVARHPGFALNVSKILDAPVRGGWPGALEEFWRWAQHRPGCPPGLRVVSTDDRRAVDVGGPAADGSWVEIHGPDWALTAVFSGGDNIGSAMLEHRLRIAATMGEISWLVGLTVDWMLRES